MDCSICCEKFNKSSHFKVECKTCEDDSMTACRSCCKKYLIDNSITPKCMICKVEWDKDFLFDNFTKIFINKDLKEIKENTLLEIEISKLPDSQNDAENAKIIKGLEKQILILRECEFKLKDKLLKNKKNIQEITNTIYEIKRHKPTKLIKEFTCKCPIDDCKGFLDEKYNCGLCDNQICIKCMEIKNEEHECDSDKVETIKLLKKDTKGCPKCGQLIYKIDGCDQMWCPPCHTTFSWRTGQVEEGNIHNPEYYRWMRENNQTLARNPGDEPFDPCGNNNINIRMLNEIIMINFKPHTKESLQIFNMHRLVGHIDMLIRYQNTINIENEDTLKNMRIDYLLNDLGKLTWKTKLQIIDKKQEKEKQMINIWTLLKYVIIEYMGKISENFRVNRDVHQIIIDILTESKKIILYCNNSFKKIGKIYNCVYPGITSEWTLINNWKAYQKRITKK